MAGHIVSLRKDPFSNLGEQCVWTNGQSWSWSMRVCPFKASISEIGYIIDHALPHTVCDWATDPIAEERTVNSLLRGSVNFHGRRKMETMSSQSWWHLQHLPYMFYSPKFWESTNSTWPIKERWKKSNQSQQPQSRCSFHQGLLLEVSSI